MMISLKIVDNAKSAWKWFSVQAMALAAAIQGAWMFVPEDMKTSIPANLVQAVTVSLLALGIAGRLVQQGKL
jgi:hypothetical protein